MASNGSSCVGLCTGSNARKHIWNDGSVTDSQDNVLGNVYDET